MTDKPNAFAFYDPDGFVPAWKHAEKFAGEGGRIATLPDIIEARLASKPRDPSWEMYFTTTSAEFAGLSKEGNPIAIVAHGVGPMSTLDGILAAYSHEFKDKSRNNRGGRISREDFLKLADGGFGDVVVCDLKAAWERRAYPFSGHPVTAEEIAAEPLWRARLGPRWEEYCAWHEGFALEWEEEENIMPVKHRPCILAMDSAANCSYGCKEIFDHWVKTSPDKAVAHLLGIGGLMHSHHDYYKGHDYNHREQRKSLASDVECHEWWNGVRIVGIPRNAGMIRMHAGLPNRRETFDKHLDKLWVPNPGGGPITHGFWHLIEVGERMFTDYPKAGERMDTGEPEFAVTSIEPAGEVEFSTTIGGYYGFLKYGIDEVRRIAPQGANAYTLGDMRIEGERHVGPATFYRVGVDTSRRLRRMADVYRDFDLILALSN